MRTNLKKILASAQYLVSLINDILDMSRIESGKLVMEEENFSLADTVEEIKDMMKNQAKERQVTFDVDLRIRHAWLVSDPVRLRQVLINQMCIRDRPQTKKIIVGLSCQHSGGSDSEDIDVSGAQQNGGCLLDVLEF